jgi:hypothetical protein
MYDQIESEKLGIRVFGVPPQPRGLLFLSADAFC